NRALLVTAVVAGGRQSIEIEALILQGVDKLVEQGGPIEGLLETVDDEENVLFRIVEARELTLHEREPGLLEVEVAGQVRESHEHLLGPGLLPFGDVLLEGLFEVLSERIPRDTTTGDGT